MTDEQNMIATNKKTKKSKNISYENQQMTI